MDLNWTTQCPDATKVYVALLENIGYLQPLKHPLTIVEGIVVMPLVATGVLKDDDWRQSLIVVDNVSSIRTVSLATPRLGDDPRQVYHSFSTFVRKYGEIGAWVVCEVHFLIPRWQHTVEPACVVSRLTSNDKCDLRAARAHSLVLLLPPSFSDSAWVRDDMAGEEDNHNQAT